MGLYLRKSIRVGPLRFNLSRSGVGISVGIPGFRVGSGPRGNYVHMGRGGLYYRATLLHNTSSRLAPRHRQQPLPPRAPATTHAPLEEIESADVSQIVDSTSAELLDELKRKRKKLRLLPVVIVVLITMLGIGISKGWPSAVMLALLVTGLLGSVFIHTRDVLGKTVVLFYDFDTQMEAAYARLHVAATELSHCATAWHIEAAGEVYDRKYHAGASNLIKRRKTSIRRAPPPFLKTNIETIALNVGRQTLYFFPDRLFVYDREGIGAVSYRELRVTVTPTRFIEGEQVPRDAEVIGHTWRYVNKSGGPDRRFKDNPQLPVCRYEEILLTSLNGIREMVEVSKCGRGEPFRQAILALASVMPSEAVPSPLSIE